MPVRFAPGVKFLFRGQVWEAGQITGGQVRAHSTDFGVRESFPLKDLITAWTDGSLRFQFPKGYEELAALEGAVKPERGVEGDIWPELSLVPAHLRPELKRRLQVVQRLESAPATKQAYVGVLTTLQAEGVKPPSLRQAHEWLQRFRQGGQTLASLLPECSGRPAAYDERLLRFIDRRIADDYLTRERPSIENIRKLVVADLVAYNEALDELDRIEIPTKGALRKKISREIAGLDAYVVMAARCGRKAADLKFKGTNYLPLPERILQIVEIDHTRLDLFVAGVGARPWLTIARDKRSGLVVGYYLGFEPPSVASVMYCLRHAIMPKTYLSERFPDIKHAWEAYGLPEILVVDNGKEFHSASLQRACERLGIELRYCPPGKPWHKGSVERHFRTINLQLLAGLKGRAFSSIAERGDYDPEKNAVISMAGLAELVHIYLVDVYPWDHHRGVKGIPGEIWREQLAVYPPALPPSTTELTILLSGTDRRKVQRTGIQWENLFYNSDELQALRQRQGARLEVDFHFNHGDIGCIWVADVVSRCWLEVPVTDQGYADGLSYWAHRSNQQLLNSEGVAVNHEALADAQKRQERLLAREARLVKERMRRARRETGGKDLRNVHPDALDAGEISGSNPSSITPEKDTASPSLPSVQALDEELQPEDLDFDGWTFESVPAEQTSAIGG